MDENRPQRPRDEDFEKTYKVKPVTETEYDPSPKAWVIALIIAAGVLLAAVGLSVFHLMRANHTQQFAAAATTVAQVEIYIESEESTEAGTSESMAIPAIEEKTKASKDETENTESDETDDADASDDDEEDTAESSASQDEEPESTDTDTVSPSQENTPAPESTEVWVELPEIGGMIYQVSQDKAVLTKSYDADPVVELSAVVSYNGTDYRFVGVGEDAFRDWTYQSRIDLPEGVTYISNRAFQNCTELREIVIPNSVTWIAEDAFQGCTGLTIVSRVNTEAQRYATAHGFNWREGTGLAGE